MIVKSKKSQGEKKEQFEIVIGNLKEAYNLEFKDLEENKHYLTLSGNFTLRTRKGGKTIFDEMDLKTKTSTSSAHTYSFKKEVSATRKKASQLAGVNAIITIKPDMDVALNLNIYASSLKAYTSAWADIDVTSFDLKLYK